jgi:hypothetical protein
MSSKNITPFELAQTAIALCHLRSQAWPDDDWQRKAFFRKAKASLAEAQEFLHEAPKDSAAIIMFRYGFEDLDLCFRAGQSAPFDLLLKPIPEQSRGDIKSKKPRTHVGTITTINGLEKGINRWFSKADAHRIIRAKAMKENEWKQLLQAQKNAIQVRAAKRVKG